jgi:hypothetical protein
MKRWILTLMLITIASPALSLKVPYETWMGAYIGESKVGYLSFTITEAELDGVRGYRIESSIKNQLTVLGAELTQLVSTVLFTDDKYEPLREEFSMSSGGKTTTVSAKFTKDRVECVVSAGSGTTTKSIPIPQGANLVGDAMFAMLEPNPEVGREYDLHYFNPITLAVEDLKIKIERREKIAIRGKEYDTVVMRNVTPMGEMTLWQDSEGGVVKVDAIMGISMIRESKEEAIAGLNGGGEDFAVRTRVRTNKPIESPGTVKILDLLLTGLDDPKMAIVDSRQKTMPLTKPDGAIHFRITADDSVPTRPLNRPVRKPELAAYLATTPYVDHEEASIKARADQIVGSEKNSYAACSRIRSWLHSNMQVKADIGITRSASDVLKSRVGVCRDYAILFAALARAAGIPAKVVSGLVYLNDGFYYHAWVECYVGKWVPFDATRSTDFVDATHIKLAEGDATSMFALAKVIGSLKAEIRGTK